MKHYLETLQIDINKEVNKILNDDRLTDNDKNSIIEKAIKTMHRSAHNIKELYA